MTSITWITSDCFIDVDLPIIRAFSSEEQYVINWHLIYTLKGLPTFTPEEIEHEIGDGSVTADYLYLKHRLRSYDTLLNFIKLMIRIRKSHPDVIYIDSETEPFFPVLSRLFLGKKKVIFAIHDIKPHVGVKAIYRLLLALKLKMFKNYHVFSINQKNIFDSKKYIGKRNVFYAPLFLKDFGKSELTPQSDKIQFLFFGIIRKNKGIEYLIDAANKLAISHKGRFVVRVAGQCDDWSQYGNKISDSSVFDLTIGPIPNDDIADLFCTSHFLVLPYKDVTQSGPLMIAFNYGIPAIASDLSGFVEHITDNSTGYLFEPGNSDALYDIMNSVLTHPLEDYEKIKHNLLIYVSDNYSTVKIKALYMNMFSQCLTP